MCGVRGGGGKYGESALQVHCMQQKETPSHYPPHAWTRISKVQLTEHIRRYLQSTTCRFVRLNVSQVVFCQTHLQIWLLTSRQCSQFTSKHGLDAKSSDIPPVDVPPASLSASRGVDSGVQASRFIRHSTVQNCRRRASTSLSRRLSGRFRRATKISRQGESGTPRRRRLAGAAVGHGTISGF